MNTANVCSNLYPKTSPQYCQSVTLKLRFVKRKSTLVKTTTRNAFNPFTAMLASAKLETIQAFSSFVWTREKSSIKMHRIESRFVKGPSKRVFAGVYVCTFQPGNFTGWSSEGVKDTMKEENNPRQSSINQCWLLGSQLARLTGRQLATLSNLSPVSKIALITRDIV